MSATARLMIGVGATVVGAQNHRLTGPPATGPARAAAQRRGGGRRVALLGRGNKIEVTKRARARTGLGLQEAKEYVENLAKTT